MIVAIDRFLAWEENKIEGKGVAAKYME